jgi:hypothetical protein
MGDAVRRSLDLGIRCDTARRESRVGPDRSVRAEAYSRPDRLFQMWLFTVGMTRLLLRSTKSEEHPTRIDVLFQGVQFIGLPTRLDGL